MGADDLFGAGENLIQGHGSGVEDDGVGSGLEGGFGAVAVAVVALFQFADDGLLGETLLLGGEGIGRLTVSVLGERWRRGDPIREWPGGSGGCRGPRGLRRGRF